MVGHYSERWVSVSLLEPGRVYYRHITDETWLVLGVACRGKAVHNGVPCLRMVSWKNQPELVWLPYDSIRGWERVESL